MTQYLECNKKNKILVRGGAMSGSIKTLFVLICIETNICTFECESMSPVRFPSSFNFYHHLTFITAYNSL